MAVPNPPSLSSVCTEFGAPFATPLSAFLRGGAWVPNTAANAGVPTALPLSLSQLAGAVAYTPMTVTAPSTTGNSVSGTTNGTIVGANANVSVSGGLAPFTYSITYVSGTSYTIVAPTSATTSFKRPGNPAPSDVFGTYRATVTDATSATAFANFSVEDSRF